MGGLIWYQSIGKSRAVMNITLLCGHILETDADEVDLDTRHGLMTRRDSLPRVEVERSGAWCMFFR